MKKVIDINCIKSTKYFLERPKKKMKTTDIYQRIQLEIKLLEKKKTFEAEYSSGRYVQGKLNQNS